MAYLTSTFDANITNRMIRPAFYSSGEKMLGWDVPVNNIDEIPKHWLSFPVVDTYLHYGIAIIYVFLMIMSLFGNGMVIWIFITTKSLRSASNFFVVNLAIADFIMMLKAPIFIYNSMFEGYALGKFWCQVFATMGSYSGIVQALTNLCIAYDRYRNISSPMDGQMKKLNAIIFVILTWAYATPWTLMPLLEVWSRFVPEGYLTSCTFDYLTDTFENKLFVFFIFIFAYVIPMSLIIFFYSQIVSQVFNHEKALRAQAKKMNVESLRSGDQAAVSAEVRIAKTAISICGLFVASWTPYAVAALIGSFGDKELLTPSVSMIPAICCKLVACFDPYVYAISHPKFRLELQARFSCLKINEKAPEKSDAATANATVST
ncbi:opsin, ultraviolet-sensitive-like [Neocloeon triangulifer]|uniref:opsin, ultraviolet-sensitive-like n=1 Tax=Neocloeon triangulifer TaxID=2078957 RepID=UPI00286F7A3B|nr:opsin, ultraviolet-sensitive-like [Neocloeon triangulifer]